MFEEVARRGVDPGLLEQTAGNQFRLRVYPLPPGGSRRVQLVIREPLAFAGQSWQWTLPLQFAAGAASVELKVHAPDAATAGTAPFRISAGQLQWQGKGAQLPKQLQWNLPAARHAQVQVAPWQDGHYLLAQLPVAASSTPRTLPSEIGLLWDGSGSAGQRDRTREFALLDRYFAALGDGTVALTVLRDRAEPVRRFRIRAGNWNELRAALQAVRPDGASALAQWQSQPGVKEYLLVSDGLLTYGPEQLPAMALDQRLFAVSSAGARTDAVRLRGWTEARGGRFVALGEDVDAAARELLSSPLDVQVDAGRGVQDVVIDRRSEAQGWLWLHARLAADSVRMRVRVGGGEWQALPATQKSNDGELLAGLWAQARLQQLAADRRGNREAMQRLSQQFGLVGPDTSLIVLETLEDYLRYAIRPSGTLRAGYDARFAVQVRDRAAADRQRLDEVAARWKERQQWWSRSWPKGRHRRRRAGHWKWPRRTMRWNRRRWQCSPRRPLRHRPPRHRWPPPPSSAWKPAARVHVARRLHRTRPWIQLRSLVAVSLRPLPPTRASSVSSWRPGSRTRPSPGACARARRRNCMTATWPSAMRMPTAARSSSTWPTCCWSRVSATWHCACCRTWPRWTWTTATCCACSVTG